MVKDPKLSSKIFKNMLLKMRGAKEGNGTIPVGGTLQDLREKMTSLPIVGSRVAIHYARILDGKEFIVFVTQKSKTKILVECPENDFCKRFLVEELGNALIEAATFTRI